MNTNTNNNTTKRTTWKRAVALVTACHILTFAVMPSFGLALAEGSSIVAQGTKAGEATKPTAGATSAPKGTKESLGLEVSSAILMEASTGQILVDYNSKTALPPASMTKMMTEYIVLEKIKSKEISWNSEVPTTKHAALTQGSRIFLAENDKHTVKELYIAMAIGSANDATVALAEFISGTEAKFVDLMNDTAKRLGMETAHFINSTGLGRDDMPKEFQPASKEETVMSAMDVAKLVQAIVVDHSNFSEYTKIQKYKFRERDKTPIENLNWMLEANKSVPNFKRYAYQGLDGMKTGFTDEAGNCFAGTAERNGMRLITVVMGTDRKDKGKRFVETAKLMDHGFNTYELKTAVAPKNAVEGHTTAPIKKGVSTEVPIVTETGITFALPKGASIEGKLKKEVKLIPAEQLEAPIKNGQKVGTATFTYSDNGIEQKKTVNLIASEEVEKGSWWRLMFRAIQEFFVDLFMSIKGLF
ncbi:D-alanyl-D-alanine carboxypeptidase family protein [Paenibacillus sp. 481]|uniref:D-alanyl-D-alanine carboxypeptidase family protein n=1 Tax=Paenibacillus sp. 481 TaxID=2835869 RepID=UPI001E2AD009|nr:D-alanyl-D-alanine carboxypeptidase family protein [Paenibacillus sp. 481]UHA75291.1 D-alanyl-D-alanine carboxypeptidase [Paenibacillus sp. 481]